MSPICLYDYVKQYVLVKNDIFMVSDCDIGELYVIERDAPPTYSFDGLMNLFDLFMKYVYSVSCDDGMIIIEVASLPFP